ncbi:Serine/threonine-protein kinase tel1 [Tilletia horrida]|uniref:Serine/threonine-protein kinase TEL1 n=1 Tax=Tilletia horrida TaxID=155126 RepID=A0AAN6GNI4_9BASI|nr:Serine/threonine-protein kinase tel1 [Tilletia horrida]KAK0565395.1 Serine/threonine-protein kinase tel1 [Tilletia horrida]
MAPLLKDTWQLLESAKVKERGEGVARLRQLFSMRVNILHVAEHSKSNGGTYFLRTINALTACVTADRQALLKKHPKWQEAPTQALASLRKSSNAVRWFIEQANSHFDQQCLRVLLTHITSVANDRGTLFEPIALDYIKALSTLLSHPPHVQHIPADLWSHTLSFCFNALLGNKLGTPLPTQIRDEDWKMRELGPTPDSASSGAPSPQASSSLPSLGPRKEVGLQTHSLIAVVAALVTSPSAPLLNDKRGISVLYKFAAFLEMYPVAGLAHVEALRCVNSTLLLLMLNERRVTVLFVERIWKTVVPWLSGRLKELKEQVVSFAIIALPILASADLVFRGEQTDSIESEVRKIDAVRQLHELILAESSSRAGADALALESVQLVIDADEHSDMHASTASACLHLKTFRPVRHWAAQQTLSWACLQLLADCTALLTQWSQPSLSHTAHGEEALEPNGNGLDTSVKSGKRREINGGSRTAGSVRRSPSVLLTSPERSPRKRRKLENGGTAASSVAERLAVASTPYDALNALLDELEVKSGDSFATRQTRRIWAFQAVAFIAERHWSSLDNLARRDVLEVLHTQLDMPIDESHPALFLALAACAVAESDLHKNNHQKTEVHEDFWAQIWTETLRKVSVPATSRAAAHAACALLAQDAPLLHSHRLLASLRTFLQNLENEAPSAFADSTCALMRESLRHASTDVVLAKANLETRVLDWISRSWSSLSSSSRRSRLQTSHEELDAVDLALLLIQVCRLAKQGRLVRPEAVIENSDLLESLRTMKQLAVARDFLFEAKFPSEKRHDTDPDSISSPTGSSASVVTQGEDASSDSLHPMTTTQRRCYDMLTQSASDLHAQVTLRPIDGVPFDTPLDSPFAVTSLEDTLRILHFSISALALDSSLGVGGFRTPGKLKPIADALFVDFLRILKEPRWSISDRLLLLQTLRPILPPPSPSLNDQGDKWLSQALVEVGEQSGVARILVAAVPQSRSSQPLRVLSTLWSSSSLSISKVLDVFQATLKSLTSTTAGNLDSNGAENAIQDDDNDDIITAESRTETAIAPASAAHQHAFGAGVSICVEAIAMLPFLGRIDEDRNMDAWLGSHLLQVSDQLFVPIASAVLDAMASGRLDLSLNDVDAILNRIGSSLLTSYEYGRRPDVQILGAAFIQATADLWKPSNGDGVAEDFQMNVMDFFSFFVQQATRIRSWKVRLHLIGTLNAFLDVDPLQELWAEMDENFVPPETVLVQFGSDQDFAVRFVAARAQALAVQRSQIYGRDAKQLFAVIREQMTKDFKDFAMTATLLLFAANVAICSSFCRSLAMEKIIETVCDANRYLPMTHAVLKQVSAKLGIAGTQVLYKAFSASTAFETLEAQKDPLNLDVKTLGYTTIQDYIEHVISDVGTTLILYDGGRGMTHFKSLADICEMDLGEALKLCFPRVVAHRLVWMGANPSPGSDLERTYAETLEQIEVCAIEDLQLKPSAARGLLRDIISEHFYDIVVAMLKLLFDPHLSTEGTAMRFINSVDPSCAVTLRHLRGPVKSSREWQPHEPYAPYADAKAVYNGLATLRIASPSSAFDAAQVFNTVHLMLEAILCDTYLNDQLRHLDALKLWIAFNHTTVSTETILLRTILHGTVLIMHNEDLASAVFGITEWCLNMIATSDVVPTHQTGDDLSSAAHIVSRLTNGAGDGSRTGRGEEQDLLNRLETSALSLYEHNLAARQIVAYSLCAWPRRLDGRLAEIVNEIDLNDARRILASMRGRTIEAHHLETIISKLQWSGDASKLQEFAESDLWRILLMIGEQQRGTTAKTVQPLANLGDALADLIHALGGRLRAPSLATLNDLSNIVEICIGPQDSKHEVPAVAAEIAQIKLLTRSHLLEDLHSDDAGTVFASYKMLRRLRAVDQTQGPHSSFPNDHDEQELELVAIVDLDGVANSAHVDEPATLPAELTSYETWVTAVAQYLLLSLAGALQDAFLFQVGSTIETNSLLAGKLIPILMLLLCTAADYEYVGTSESSKVAAHFTSVLSNDKAPLQCWSTIVDSLLYIRANAQQAYDFKLEIDTLLMARRSLDCKLYSTALMLIELAVDSRTRRARLTGDKTSTPLENRISSLETELLHVIFANIDDPDGLHGIPEPDVKEAFLRQLHHEGHWRRALDVYASKIESDLGTSMSTKIADLRPLNSTLHHMGFNRLASMLLQTSANSVETAQYDISAPQDLDLSFDIAWRLGQWDLPNNVATETSGQGHGLWCALRAVNRESEPTVAARAVAVAAGAEVAKLRDISLESFVATRKLCRGILSFREIRAVVTGTARLHRDLQIAEMRDRCSQLDHADFEYDDMEQICAVRHAIISMHRQKLVSEQIGDLRHSALGQVVDLETSVLLNSSRCARKYNNSQKALTAVTLAQEVQTFCPETLNALAIMDEYASVLWDEGNHSMALKALQQYQTCVDSAGPTPDRADKHALVLARRGTWTATARAETARVIENNFFKVAIRNILHAAARSKEHARIAFQYAVFADGQYRHHVTSPEHHRVRRFYEQRCEEFLLTQQEYERSKTRHLKIHLNKIQKLRDADGMQLKTYEEACANFLAKALEMYATSLCCSSEHDAAVFPFISLWFENSSDTTTNELLAGYLPYIPSAKFIPLTHQLSARLIPATPTSQASPTPRTFGTNLFKLMSDMSREHPYHTLYPIFALRKAGLDFHQSRSKSASPSPSVSSQAARATAAEAIWNQVQSNPRLTARARMFEEACLGYVEWAEVNLKEQLPHLFLTNGQIKKGPHKMPSRLRMSRWKHLDVPIATKSLPVDMSGSYQHFVSITRYSEMFNTAGGLHLPKINECIGSDGKRYKQLFKHQDDLRQDAVIQQVFRLANDLLMKDQRSRVRRLAVRDYIVLPLGPQCGLLEFVPNTKPLGEVLTNLHDKLDTDFRAQEAKIQLQNASRQTPPSRVKVYADVCQRFPPAMRYHFLEAQKVPAAWQVMRLGYTRSVATTSIVGHILGMGDRHVSNILMDEDSGEVVHIDFGIVFEQGKMLPVPELVPFRLTRDLVDGMGILGVEGVYRRCCEETLRVLRDGADTIKQVLEVFKYDPLFEWMTNPIKLLRAQPAAEEDAEGYRSSVAVGRSTATTSDAPGSGHQDTAEISADHAVSTVMAKLSKSLSVEYTVNDLIQQARNVDHLGAIYFVKYQHFPRVTIFIIFKAKNRFYVTQQ